MGARDQTNGAFEVQLHGRWLDPRQFRCLLGVLFALVLADGVITAFLIENGLATEFNPLLAAAVGGPMFLPVKLAGAATGVLTLWRAYRSRPRLAGSCIMCLVAFYTLIVYWNAFLSVAAQA